VDDRHLPQPVQLAQGAEMGRFLLGSTVILLFPKNVLSFGARYGAGTATRMGEALGTYH
jgi:phosphatidylserine decarboxylase